LLGARKQPRGGPPREGPQGQRDCGAERPRRRVRRSRAWSPPAPSRRTFWPRPPAAQCTSRRAGSAFHPEMSA
jgi:hypothetical protein